MADPLASYEDVVTMMGAGCDLDASQVQALLRLASARARAYTGCEWDDVTGLPDGVTEVVASMVVRALQNPRGVTQETAGPFAASYGSDAAARVYLTAQDKEVLDANRCKSRLWILSPTRGDLETPPVDPFYVDSESWETA